MGVKIKKEVPKKVTISAEEDLKSRLTLAVPCMGVILMAVMGTYASSPVIAGNAKAVTIFWALAAVGVIYSFCMYMWKATAGQKGITVRSLISGERTILYDNIKKVEVKKINEDILYYTVIRKNDRKFLRMYPVMTNCGAMLERLRKLGVKIVEI